LPIALRTRPSGRAAWLVGVTLVAGTVACGSRTGLEGGAGAPRLLAPLSTSRVTNRRPTLHWELPRGVTDATLDMCRDRACTRPIGAPIHVVGTSYAPPADLPVGVVYWRVHPSIATGVTSATWEFSVGARSARTDTSWGTTLDVNGDGYADIALGDNNQRTAYVYLGGPSGVEASPATTLVDPKGTSEAFGESIAGAGDVNGDGYADLVVGAPVIGQPTVAGSAYVYLGGPSGLASSPAATLTGMAGAADHWFGWSLAAAGDLNGDGYGDLVIGAPTSGRAYLYLGGESGLSTEPATILASADAMSRLGEAVACSGNANGGGEVVLAVGAPALQGGTGSLSLLAYGDSGLTSVATQPGPDGPGAYFGQFISNGGDINGDGYSDLAIGAPNEGGGVGRAYVDFGGPSGLVTAPTGLNPPRGALRGFGDGAASAGDVNGDGYGDLIVGDLDVTSFHAQVYIYLGSPDGIPSLPAVTLTDPTGQGGQFGVDFASAGDVDGDGYADVVVSSLGPSLGEPAVVYIFSGGATGLSAVPAAAITSGSISLGSAVFGASN
jgi:hypothetical protein